MIESVPAAVLGSLSIISPFPTDGRAEYDTRAYRGLDLSRIISCWGWQHFM